MAFQPLVNEQTVNPPYLVSVRVPLKREILFASCTAVLTAG